jgi:hypothetical protein
VNLTNFTDEELCIITIILDEETEEEKKKIPKRRKWVHEAWQKRILDTIYIYIHIFWI